MTTFVVLLPLAKGGGPSIETMSIMVCVVVVFLFVSHFYQRTAERRRSEQFGAVGRDLHFEFGPDGDPTLLESLSRSFHRLAVGEHTQIKNLLRSKNEKLEVTMFEYHLRIKHTIVTSMIVFRIPGASLPRFVMQPKELAGKFLWARLGFQNIAPADHPEFSKRYMLRGDDEAAVRQFFGFAICDYIAKNKRLYVEACGDSLLYCSSTAVRIKPLEVHKFLEEGLKLLSLFHPNVSSSCADSRLG